MSFGGKIGIDATTKLPEEKTSVGNSISDFNNSISDFVLLSSDFKEIKSVNFSLSEKGIPLIFLSMEKSKKNHIREIGNELFKRQEFKNIKVIIFLDSTVDITDVADAVWRFANNVDPKRDSFIIEATSDNECSHLVMDGTRKTKEHDDFQREWPNILASDEQT